MLDKMPFVTTAVAALLAALFLYDLAAFGNGYDGEDDGFGTICLAPSKTLGSLQLWRVYAAPLFHVSFAHLFFNLVAFVPLASALEQRMGSASFAYILFVLSTLGGVGYSILAYLLLPFAPGLPEACVVGYSGVIFGLIAVENVLLERTTVQPFGLFSMPAAAYPWALLFFIQMLVPQASFLGHLCGLLAGLVYIHFFHARIQRRLEASVANLEAASAGRAVIGRLPRYRPAPEGGLPLVQEARVEEVRANVINSCSSVVHRLQGLRSYMPLSTVQDRPSAQDSGYGSSSGAGQRLGGGSADVEAPTGWQPSSGGSAPPAASAAASAAEARVKRQNSRS